ncbi:hypothetical protein E8E12_011037 [Didymella heteroderae]|uniref:Uncharacterized protein n=1 Tax=Didymella heteroderae TaxID=1769908 RepID=A0A9P4X0C0_9PLEO|nr:hypothetical protein E8E12_011037 [Didymella heteroderae]
MDVAKLFKSLSGMTLAQKYQAQDNHMNNFLMRIVEDQTEMQTKGTGCAQMSQAKKSLSAAIDEKADRLAELAKLYIILETLLDDLKVTVEKHWSQVSKRSFNERMTAIENLQADYEEILEAKRKGIQAVARKAKFQVQRSAGRNSKGA